LIVQAMSSRVISITTVIEEMTMTDLFHVSGSSPTSTNLARFRKFFSETGAPSLPDASPECLAATVEALRRTDGLYDQLAARGIDLNDESAVSDDEFERLTAAIDRQTGLDKFDDREQIAAILWLLDHGESA
jgi:hypothetical protein